MIQAAAPERLIAGTLPIEAMVAHFLVVQVGLVSAAKESHRAE